MKLLPARLYSPAFAVFLLVVSLLQSAGTASSPSYTVSDAQDDAYFDAVYSGEVYDLEGGVLWEDENIKITSWGIKQDSYNLGLSLDVENKSDVDLAVQLRGFSMNGWSIGTYFSCDVPAGRTTADMLIFEENDMALAGIDEINQIKLYFYVFNWDDTRSSYLSELITIGNDYDYSAQYDSFDGITLYDDYGIKIVLPEIEYSNLYGPRIPLYIENDTNKTIMISLWTFEINGIEVQSYYSCDLLPHTVYIGYINNFDNYTDLYGIEECMEMTFEFDINSFDFSLSLSPDPITVTLD